MKNPRRALPITGQCWALAIALAVLMLASVPSQAQESVDPQAEAEKIRDLGRQWQEAAQAGDVDTIVGLYAEDGRLLPPDAPQTDSKEAIREFWANLLELPKVELTITPSTVEVAEAGDMAYDVGTYTLAFESENGPVRDEGKYVVVWVKEEDAWKAAADIFNSDGAERQ